jgi:hypothetical protein
MPGHRPIDARAGEAEPVVADDPPAAAPGPGARIARTSQQVGGAGAAVIVLVWLARLAHIDLDPDSAAVTPAPEVIVALTGLLSIGGSWLMNRSHG